MIPRVLLTACIWALVALGSQAVVLRSQAVLGTTRELLPRKTYTYNVKSSAISCSPPNKIFKSTSNNGNDITTLMTFKYTSAMAGKTCQFGFELSNSDTLTGSKTFQLFSSLEPVQSCPTNSGNKRNNHLGTMKAKVGKGTWVEQFMPIAKPGPCGNAGAVEAFELVGVGDNVHIAWTGRSGPRIYYWKDGDL